MESALVPHVRAQVLATSICLGFVAYLALLANVNRPGNLDWGLQRVLSSLAIVYLCIYISSQLIAVSSHFFVMLVSPPACASGPLAPATCPLVPWCDS